MMYCFPAKNLMKSRDETFVESLINMYRNSNYYLAGHDRYSELKEPSLDDLLCELTFIKNNYDAKFEYKTERVVIGYDTVDGYIHNDINIPSIIFTTNEVILKNSDGLDINFGKFEIILDFRKDYQAYEKRCVTNFCVSAKALDPNPSVSNDNVTHPNVSDEDICLGEGDGAIKIAFKEARFSDIIELIISILNTHSDSPYVHIDNWFKNICVNCGEVQEEEEEEARCSECHDNTCKKCSVECDICKKLHHSGCGFYCGDCDERKCYCYFKSNGRRYEECCDECWEKRLEDERLEEEEEEEERLLEEERLEQERLEELEEDELEENEEEDLK